MRARHHKQCRYNPKQQAELCADAIADSLRMQDRGPEICTLGRRVNTEAFPTVILPTFLGFTFRVATIFSSGCPNHTTCGPNGNSETYSYVR